MAVTANIQVAITSRSEQFKRGISESTGALRLFGKASDETKRQVQAAARGIEQEWKNLGRQSKAMAKLVAANQAEAFMARQGMIGRSMQGGMVDRQTNPFNSPLQSGYVAAAVVAAGFNGPEFARSIRQRRWAEADFSRRGLTAGSDDFVQQAMRSAATSANARVASGALVQSDALKSKLAGASQHSATILANFNRYARLLRGGGILIGLTAIARTVEGIAESFKRSAEAAADLSRVPIPRWLTIVHGIPFLNMATSAGQAFADAESIEELSRLERLRGELQAQIDAKERMKAGLKARRDVANEFKGKFATSFGRQEFIDLARPHAPQDQLADFIRRGTSLVKLGALLPGTAIDAVIGKAKELKLDFGSIWDEFTKEGVGRFVGNLLTGKTEHQWRPLAKPLAVGLGQEVSPGMLGLGGLASRTRDDEKVKLLTQIRDKIAINQTGQATWQGP